MAARFSALTVETVKQDGKMEAIISNIKIPEKLSDVGKLPTSKLGMPIIGNFELEVPIVLEDGTCTTIGVRGIAYLNKNVMVAVEQDAKNTAHAIEKFNEAIKVLQTLNLDAKTVNDILSKITKS